MKFPRPIPVRDIADRFGAVIIGDANLVATGINEIHKVEPGDIVFSDLEKYFKPALNSAATIILLPKEMPAMEGKAILVHDNPFMVYNTLVKEHRPFLPLTTNISDSAEIDSSTVIEPNVVIGNHAVIGKNCYIQANVYIGDYTVIGDNVSIHAGTSIGTDAFYYKRTDEKLIKWHTGGRVVIGNDVEIGANCTINKGVSGDTVIGDGTKFDSLIHIGHGAVVGKNCLFAAQVGIGGKTIIEDGVVLYGQVGVAQNLRIGAGATVLAQSGIARDLEGGKIYFGSPAVEASIKFREIAAMQYLPELVKRMNGKKEK